jgi:spectinomycin phosphotransferase
MLEKPELKAKQIIDCLRAEYGLSVETISFLSLGADVDTSVGRVRTKDRVDYFVKLRRGNFNEASVTIPSFLNASGIEQVIPPLTTRNGQLWTNLYPFKITLYPFVDGQPGLDIKMSEQQWFEFGKALKRFHTANFPEVLTGGIPRDDFSPRWRDFVSTYLVHVEKIAFNKAIEMEAAKVLKFRKAKILEIVRRAEQLALRVQEELLEFILCHSDIHGYNLLIDNKGALYIVDWDGLTFAPKERDLMFIGGGHGDSGYTPQEEEAMFYQGYGDANINQTALAYYRYERIILDIADDCSIIFSSDEDEAHQTAALEDLTNKFLPDCYIEIAYRSDKVSKRRS